MNCIKCGSKQPFYGLKFHGKADFTQRRKEMFEWTLRNACDERRKGPLARNSLPAILFFF